MMALLRKAVAVAVLAGLFLAGGRAEAGPEVLIKVGYAPGGSQDVYARVIARHLGRFLPGNPQIEVLNLPGAGGRKLLRLAEAAPETDGSVIYGITFSTISGEALIQAEAGETPFLPPMLGGLTRTGSFCRVLAEGPIGTAGDLFGDGVRFGATGRTSSTYVIPAALRTALGVPFRIVTGFSGMAESFAALERGEVDVICGIDPVVETPFRIVASITPVPGATVPALSDRIADPADLAILRLVERQASVGSAMFLAVHASAEVVARRRAAFAALVADPAFRADLAKIGLDLPPQAGEELSAMLEEFAGMDAATRARFLEMTR